jgi:tetratricopeptide (TPR) repeat protein
LPCQPGPASTPAPHHTPPPPTRPQGSNQLKAEGNRLHSSGDFAAAAEKYERARANLEDFTSSEAVALRRACVLNLGSCYLQLGRFHDALDMCTSILKGEGDVGM